MKKILMLLTIVLLMIASATVVFSAELTEEDLSSLITINTIEDGDVFVAGSDIVLGVENGLGDVLNIDFYANGTKIPASLTTGENETIIWNAPASGSYTIYAEATFLENSDNNYVKTQSAPVKIKVLDDTRRIINFANATDFSYVSAGKAGSELISGSTCEWNATYVRVGEKSLHYTGDATKNNDFYYRVNVPFSTAIGAEAKFMFWVYNASDQAVKLGAWATVDETSKAPSYNSYNLETLTPGWNLISFPIGNAAVNEPIQYTKFELSSCFNVVSEEDANGAANMAVDLYFGEPWISNDGDEVFVATPVIEDGHLKADNRLEAYRINFSHELKSPIDATMAVSLKKDGQSIDVAKRAGADYIELVPINALEYGSYTVEIEGNQIYDVYGRALEAASFSFETKDTILDNAIPAPSIVYPSDGDKVNIDDVKITVRGIFADGITNVEFYDRETGEEVFVGSTTLKRADEEYQINPELSAGTHAIYALVTYKTKDGTEALGTNLITFEVVEENLFEINDIELNKQSIVLMQGATETITATIEPVSAADESVVWFSSDSSVATVKNGLITAVNGGRAIITAATKEGRAAQCTVMVNTSSVPATGIEISKTNTVIVAGKTETITANVLPDNATNQAVTWKSSDETVATVSNGTITALKVGTANITATSADGSFEAICAVEVVGEKISVTGISLNKTSSLIYVGESEKLIATITPEDATNKEIEWISLNEYVATVSNDGTVKAIGEGTVVIRAKSADGGYAADCTITVEKAPIIMPTGIQLNRTSLELNPGESKIVVATILPPGATYNKVTWESSDESVAKVFDGTVTAISKGTATIKATNVKGEGSASITVTVGEGTVVDPNLYEIERILELKPGLTAIAAGMWGNNASTNAQREYTTDYARVGNYTFHYDGDAALGQQNFSCAYTVDFSSNAEKWNTTATAENGLELKLWVYNASEEVDLVLFPNKVSGPDTSSTWVQHTIKPGWNLISHKLGNRTAGEAIVYDKIRFYGYGYGTGDGADGRVSTAGKDLDLYFGEPWLEKYNSEGEFKVSSTSVENGSTEVNPELESYRISFNNTINQPGDAMRAISLIDSKGNVVEGVDMVAGRDYVDILINDADMASPIRLKNDEEYTVKINGTGVYDYVGNELTSAEYTFTTEPYPATLVIGTEEERIGDNVKVKLSLTSEEPINYIKISNFTFDADKLSFVGFSDYDTIAELVDDEPIFDAVNKVIEINLAQENVFSGDICSMEFKINDSAEVNDNIAIEATTVVKNGEEYIGVATTSGAIKVVEGLYGDVNGDGVVNALDLTLVRKYIVGGYNVEMNEFHADINKDAKINVKDILLMHKASTPQ